MNYSALIQNRKSVREFMDREVPFSDIDRIRSYYLNQVRRLIPEIKTELLLPQISMFIAPTTAA